jgi:hypothetical protein
MLSRFAVVMLAGCASASMQSGDASHGVDASHDDADIDAPAGHADAAVDAAPHPDGPSGSCASAMTGTLAVWSFTSEAGNQTQTAASMTATGVTAGAVSRSTGLVATSGSMSINSSMWSQSATNDGTTYYTFSVTPPAGCTMDLTQLAVDTKASSTGAHSAAVGTSADAFAATTAVSATTTATVTNAALSVSGATGAIELRVFGWAATATGGTFRIENTLTLTGTLR